MRHSGGQVNVPGVPWGGMLRATCSALHCSRWGLGIDPGAEHCIRAPCGKLAVRDPRSQITDQRSVTIKVADSRSLPSSSRVLECKVHPVWHSWGRRNLGNARRKC